MWHLHNGCSSHMNVDNDAFLSLTPFNGGDIMFNCWDESQIAKKGVANFPGLLQLENVGYVDGFKTSLICINQLCGEVADDLCFSKGGCRIVYKYRK